MVRLSGYLFFLLILSSLCLAYLPGSDSDLKNKAFAVELTLREGELSAGLPYQATFIFSNTGSSGLYTAELFAVNGSVLDRLSFDMDSDYTLMMPFSAQGSFIRISKGSKTLAQISLSESVDYCGDGVCQKDERCNLDCGQKLSAQYYVAVMIVIVLVVVFVLSRVLLHAKQ